VPLILEEQGLGDLIVETLGIGTVGRDMAGWRQMVETINTPKKSLNIAVVGKYVDLHDSYISVREALLHAGLYHNRDIEVQWVPSEEVEQEGADGFLHSAGGIVIPGGFGPRGVEGMIETVRYARDHEVPYLGLCLGMQVMVVESSRNKLGMRRANSTEFDPDTPDPVIDLMPDQKDVEQMGGTMRLGVYPCRVVEGSWAAKAYGLPEVLERHRHRFEFNNAYREALESVDLWPTGLSPDGRLVEIMEMAEHPFMVGVQFHPEFLSRPNQPHPLFREFIAVAKQTLREGGQHALPIATADAGKKG
jgi:CTP synthase